ncbi:MAG: hypothetical protein ABR534_05765 [Desulfotignum sp.]
MEDHPEAVVSLFVSLSMAELMPDRQTLNRMSENQQMLLNTLCRSAANDALAMSETTLQCNACADGFCDMPDTKPVWDYPDKNSCTC